MNKYINEDVSIAQSLRIQKHNSKAFHFTEKQFHNRFKCMNHNINHRTARTVNVKGEKHGNTE